VYPSPVSYPSSNAVLYKSGVLNVITFGPPLNTKLCFSSREARIAKVSVMLDILFLGILVDNVDHLQKHSALERGIYVHLQVLRAYGGRITYRLLSEQKVL